MILDENVYTESNPALLCRFGGTDHPGLAAFRTASGQEEHGSVAGEY